MLQQVRAPTTVSLVLGGGGARGLAHIGVIEWLTGNGYSISSIAGSSMGALVGGIYAAGRLDVYAEWVLALERFQVLRLLDPSLGRTGLFKGERIISVLRQLIGERAIEELAIDFTAVATDLESGEEVWLRDGKLFDAIRASIATPLVFTPFRIGDRVLLDGALVNPVPMAAAGGAEAELTVAVNLGAPVEALREPPKPTPKPDPEADTGSSAYAKRIRAFIEGMQRDAVPAAPTHRLLDIAFSSMQIMQDTIAQLKLAEIPPDITVQIPRNACGLYEFWRARELIELGRERAALAFAARAVDAAVRLTAA